jgi:alkylation response protein AidB-like acyl-CoA dehydrogenase
MDLSYTAEYESYRAELRDFLSTRWDKSWLKGADAATRSAEFRAKAIAHGYLYRNVPRQYGGSEQTPDVLKAQIIREEFARVRAPAELGGPGVTMLVPTLIECGTDAQKERFIAKTINGEYNWAQGYSEPGAGSDLVSLKTRGVLDGDERVITGQKIWTSWAHKAHYMFALVRTEPEEPRHKGISYILLDMKQPGVTVRPLKQITGGREFCEVFLDGARAPLSWMVGERGHGWDVSRSTLKHERNLVGGAATLEDLFDKLVALAKTTSLNGRPAIESPQIQDRLVAIEGYVKSHLYSSFSQLTDEANGRPAARMGMMNKLNATNIGQDIANLATQIIGSSAMLFPGNLQSAGNERWINQVLGSLALSIAGGAANIQRNIIAERGLGLPREPEAV